MIIEAIYRNKQQRQSDTEEEEEETEKGDGDDASTVMLDETESLQERLDSLDVKDEIANQEPEPAGEESKQAAEEPKQAADLNVIPEENQRNDVEGHFQDAEEEYDGAAGLWAQDLQLPCFKAAPVVEQPRVQRVGYVQATPSMSLYQPRWPAAFDDVFDIFDPPREAAPVPRRAERVQVNQCVIPAPGSTFDVLQKMTEENLNFIKERSDCAICKRALDIGVDIILKDCLHTFCRRCLVAAIENNQTAQMMCPSKVVRCETEVRDEEVKSLLTPEAYEKYQHESLFRMNIFDIAELQETYEFVENKNEFRCDICTQIIKPGEGIVLKNCLHQYCKPCLGQYIPTSPDLTVPCPFRDDDGLRCIGFIQDTEFRALVSIDVQLDFLKKSVQQAEAETLNAFHCKTPNCPVWMEIIGTQEGDFACPGCKRISCMVCKAVHEGVSCQDYQLVAQGNVRRAREDAATANQVRNLIAANQAQNCPRCGIVVQRIDGCRHMTCAKCKAEFNWTGA